MAPYNARLCYLVTLIQINVNAKLENGILHIKIPKQEKETSKRIEIKS